MVVLICCQNNGWKVKIILVTWSQITFCTGVFKQNSLTLLFAFGGGWGLLCDSVWQWEWGDLSFRLTGLLQSPLRLHRTLGGLLRSFRTMMIGVKMKQCVHSPYPSLGLFTVTLLCWYSVHSTIGTLLNLPLLSLFLQLLCFSQLGDGVLSRQYCLGNNASASGFL